MKPVRPVKTHAEDVSSFTDRRPTVSIGGWFQGKDTYLWLGLEDTCIGTLHGYKLYRLAKAIVSHYESDEEEDPYSE